MIYIFQNVSNDVINVKNASGWLDLLLCVVYFFIVLCFLKEPARAPKIASVLEANINAYLINLSITYVQAVAYSLWYVNTAVVQNWYNWNVQSTLLLTAGLVILQIPAQFVSRFRKPPLKCMMIASCFATVVSLLFVNYNQNETTRFILYVIGSVLFGSSNMLVHAINFIVAMSYL